MHPFFDKNYKDHEILVKPYQGGIQLCLKQDKDLIALLPLSECFSLPYSVYLLDKTGLTLKINQVGAKFCGFASEQEAIGHSLLSVSEQHSAHTLLANCQSVLEQAAFQMFDETNVRYDNEILQFLSLKHPAFNFKGELCGIFGVSIVLGHHALADAILHLTQLGLIKTGAKPMHTRVPLDLTDKKLTKREVDCLSLTLKGYTAKQIAKSFKLSPRTVEDYLNQLKLKFEVSSKNALIRKVLNSN